MLSVNAGGLNEQVRAITEACSSFSIPVVFALSRRGLARAVGKHSRVSIVGLLSLDEVADKVKVRPNAPQPITMNALQDMLQHANESRKRFKAATLANAL